MQHTLPYQWSFVLNMERIHQELYIFFQGQGRKFCQKFKFPDSGKNVTHETLLMIVIICAKYKKNPSRTVDATEQTRFSKSRSNDLEDIGQGQRSSHATHLLMPVIICTKYGKNPSGTVDATERTQFSRSRPNDLEDIGQGQRSLYATQPLIPVIICAKYGKNPLRILDFFFKVKAEKFQKFKFTDSEKNVTHDTPSNDSDHLCQI